MGIYLTNEKILKTNESKRSDYYWRIALGLLEKNCYRNYSNDIKEKMVIEAVSNCVKYGHNFTTKKSKNPFAYYTEIIKRAFNRIITRERKNLYKKFKLISESPIVFDEENKLLSREDWYRRDLLESIQDNVQFDVDEEYVTNYINRYERKSHHC